MFELLVHASHHSNVVIVDEVDLFKVEHLRQLASFVCEEEVGYSLCLKRQFLSQFCGIYDGVPISKQCGTGIAPGLLWSLLFFLVGIRDVLVCSEEIHLLESEPEV